MATRKTTIIERAAAIAAPAVPAPAAPRGRRPGAVRRATTAVPPVLAAAPEIHEAHGAPDLAAAEQIRVRAYYLHLERRGRPADPTGDWLRAEEELATRACNSPSQPG